MAAFASRPCLPARHGRFLVHHRPSSFLTVGAAVLLVMHTGPAAALETVWTGQAGAAQPFWDLAPNWSAGPPTAADMDAELGDHHTTLRSGSFLVNRLTGAGTLNLTGGQLRLHSKASSIGRLELRGGALVGQEGALQIGSLLWTGGQIGEASSPYENNWMEVTVKGPAVLQGTRLSFEGAWPLRLEGATVWKDGASTLDGERLVIGPQAVFHDDARTADHEMGYLAGVNLTILGRYVKTGAATTAVNNDSSDFDNRGLVEVLGGTWAQRGHPGGLWSNTGRIRVRDAHMQINTFRVSVHQGGIVDVLPNSKVTLRHDRGWFTSTGVWNIAAGGLVEVSDNEWFPPGEAWFERGVVNNEGILRFSEGNARVSRGAEVRGGGTIEVARGAYLKVERDLEVGGLMIGEPNNFGSAPPYVDADFSRMEIQGRAIVDRFDWREGRFEISGPLTVRGRAELSDSLDYWAGYSKPPSKEIKTAFTFLGPTGWDGNADLSGGGSIRIGPGARFEDRNTQGTRDTEFETLRPTRLSVAHVLNEGSYVKGGAGETVVASAFTNRGTVRSVAAGTLTFAGPLDNTGTLEADRSRVVVWGRLQQYENGRLSAGRYVARDGRLVFNLGDAGYQPGPALIHLNQGSIVLDGKQASLVTLWRGVELDALSGGATNWGQLSLMRGATLQTASISNQGRLDVGVGSVLHADMFWQANLEAAATDAATWLAGAFDIRDVRFEQGTLSAGAEGQVGLASLLGDSVTFVGSRLLVDVAAAERYDRLRISGTATLNGELWADFHAGAVAPGRYRFLTADGGVQGSFSSVASNLDASRLRVAASYGAHYVDLVVSTAPEPGTWALTGLGLAALAGNARRRRLQPAASR